VSTEKCRYELVLKVKCYTSEKGSYVVALISFVFNNVGEGTARFDADRVLKKWRDCVGLESPCPIEGQYRRLRSVRFAGFYELVRRRVQFRIYAGEGELL
jgi:hypothetical protein